MSEEQNVIGHLLDVEKDAEMLVFEAQSEASKRITAARVEADAEYKKKYADLAQKLESDYQGKISELTSEHDKILERYKSDVQNAEKDVNSFNSFLESILFSA